MTNDGNRPPIDIERELVRVMAERRITRRQLLEAIAAVGATAALAPIVAACTTGAAGSPSASAAAATPTTAASQAASAAAAATATPEPTPLPTPEKDLYIYNWDGYIGEDTVAQFEKKY